MNKKMMRLGGAMPCLLFFVLVLLYWGDTHTLRAETQTADFYSSTEIDDPNIQTAQGRSAERTRIANERMMHISQFDERERLCHSKFLVTSCLNEVKLARARTLDQLTREEAVLNRMDRQQAAARRQQRLDEKLKKSLEK